jgi:hypothetical protein
VRVSVGIAAWAGAPAGAFGFVSFVRRESCTFIAE